MEGFFAKASEVLCEWRYSFSHKRPWTQIQEINKNSREEKNLQRRKKKNLLFNLVFWWVASYLFREESERLREWTVTPKHRDVWTLLAKGVLWTQSLPGAQGDTLLTSPLPSDAQWSVTTSGGVCEPTPVSQSNLTLCAAKRGASPGEYKGRREEEKLCIQLAGTWRNATTQIKKIKLRGGEGAEMW